MKSDRPDPNLPRGVQALLFDAADRRRRAEDGVVAVLRAAGLREVILPVLDYADPYAGVTAEGDERLYRFLDREGQALALRADFTPMAARVIAPRLGQLDGRRRSSTGATSCATRRPASGARASSRRSAPSVTGTRASRPTRRCSGCSSTRWAPFRVRRFGSRSALPDSSERWSRPRHRVPPWAAGRASRTSCGLARERRVSAMRAPSCGRGGAGRRRGGDRRRPSHGIRTFVVSFPVIRARERRREARPCGRFRAFPPSRALRRRRPGRDARRALLHRPHVRGRRRRGPGALAAGGRYDALLGRFGVAAPALGFSIGLEALAAAAAAPDVGRGPPAAHRGREGAPPRQDARGPARRRARPSASRTAGASSFRPRTGRSSCCSSRTTTSRRTSRTAAPISGSSGATASPSPARTSFRPSSCRSGRAACRSSAGPARSSGRTASPCAWARSTGGSRRGTSTRGRSRTRSSRSPAPSSSRRPCA